MDLKKKTQPFNVFFFLETQDLTAWVASQHDRHHIMFKQNAHSTGGSYCYVLLPSLSSDTPDFGEEPIKAY